MLILQHFVAFPYGIYEYIFCHYVLGKKMYLNWFLPVLTGYWQWKIFQFTIWPIGRKGNHEISYYLIIPVETLFLSITYFTHHHPKRYPIYLFILYFCNLQEIVITKRFVFINKTKSFFFVIFYANIHTCIHKTRLYSLNSFVYWLENEIKVGI